MLSLPEPGAPFHRLARTAAHRWWRPVLGTLALAAAYLLMERLGSVLSFEEPGNTWVYRMAAGLLWAAALLAVLSIQARPAGTLASVLGRPRWRWLGSCLLEAATTAFVLSIGYGVVAFATGVDYGSSIGTRQVVLTFLAFIAPTVLVAVAAELVFRGWLLQAMAAFGGGPWPANAVQAVLYAAVFCTFGPWSFTEGLVLSAVLGWLAVRTGGLEAGVALVVFLDLRTSFDEASFGLLTSDEPWIDAQWQFVALDLVMILVYASIVADLARRRGLSTVAPGPSQAAVPAPV